MWIQDIGILYILYYPLFHTPFIESVYYFCDCEDWGFTDVQYKWCLYLYNNLQNPKSRRCITPIPTKRTSHAQHKYQHIPLYSLVKYKVWMRLDNLRCQLLGFVLNIPFSLRFVGTENFIKVYVTLILNKNNIIL